MEEHLRPGNGLDKNTSVGPLINEEGIAKCESLVDDALSKGATAILGGARSRMGKLIYEPTLLVDMDPKMEMATKDLSSLMKEKVHQRESTKRPMRFVSLNL